MRIPGLLVAIIGFAASLAQAQTEPVSIDGAVNPSTPPVAPLVMPQIQHRQVLDSSAAGVSVARPLSPGPNAETAMTAGAPPETTIRH